MTEQHANPHERKERPRPKRRNWKRIVLIIVLILLVTPVGLWMWPTTLYVRGSGHIMAEKDALVRASEKGPVTGIFVRSNELVEQGQLLAQLDDNEERMNLARTERDLQELLAQMQELTSLHNLERQREQIAIKQAQIQVADAEREHKWMQQLDREGAASEQEVLKAELALDLARTRLADAQVDREPLRQARVEVLQRQIESARTSVKFWEERLERRKVRAPLDGRVFMHKVTLGQVVDANQVLGQIFRQDLYEVIADLPEAWMPYLADDQEVLVEAAAYPRMRYGYLTADIDWVGGYVSPRQTGDGTVRISAILRDTKLPLKPGLACTVKVIAGQTNMLLRLAGVRPPRSAENLPARQEQTEIAADNTTAPTTQQAASQPQSQ